ncbi:MAG: hypothetical protein ACD_29C00098G0004 [uncultured bacterium]|nr:MAG: hypothetical protein ACD_29C00098G0004 [uncultured bacterium]
MHCFLLLCYTALIMMQLNRKFCVAPMMAYTDCHFRYLLRILSKHSVLYTEMVTAPAIIYGDKNYLLNFSEKEHPVALQLGGSDPDQLVQSAKIGEKWGYDEINLNVGCPSDRVQKGCFGVALMKQADLVAEIFMKMQDAIRIPVTIKTRLGVDEFDSEEFLHHFIKKIYDAGCRVFMMHARKAWLSGLSPKENRDVPPLCYERVYRLKKLFPNCEIIINGGIETLESCEDHLKLVDGVMLGRAICSNPFLLSQVDKIFYGSNKIMTREAALSDYMPYILKTYAQGVSMQKLTRHLIGLYQGQPGARQWRRLLSSDIKDDRQLIRAISRYSSLS